MRARIAYLSSPSPGIYVLNLQPEGQDSCIQFEISQAHLANIIVDGASLALRNIDSRSVPNRVPASPTESAQHERTEHRT